MIISFTGADDYCYLPDLYQVALKAATQKATLVEIGLLVFPEKMGKPRNPSYATRHAIRNSMTTAAHLCGRVIFNAILQADKNRSALSVHFEPLLKELAEYNRVQVNINARDNVRQFTEDEVHRVWIWLLTNTKGRVILQYHERSAPVIRSFIDKMNKDEFRKELGAIGIFFNPFDRWKERIQILVDGSQGRGIVPNRWTIPVEDVEWMKEFAIGQAGGLTPENISEQYTRFCADNHNVFAPSWCDMESGIRNGQTGPGDMLEVTKCDAIIDQFNEEGEFQ